MQMKSLILRSLYSQRLITLQSFLASCCLLYRCIEKKKKKSFQIKTRIIDEDFFKNIFKKWKHEPAVVWYPRKSSPSPFEFLRLQVVRWVCGHRLRENQSRRRYNARLWGFHRVRCTSNYPVAPERPGCRILLRRFWLSWCILVLPLKCCCPSRS